MLNHFFHRLFGLVQSRRHLLDGQALALRETVEHEKDLGLQLFFGPRLADLFFYGLSIVVQLHNAAWLHNYVVDYVDLGAFNPSTLSLVATVSQVGGPEQDFARQDWVFQLAFDRPILLRLYLQRKLAHLTQRFPLEFGEDHLERQTVYLVDFLSLHWYVHSKFGLEPRSLSQDLGIFRIVLRFLARVHNVPNDLIFIVKGKTVRIPQVLLELVWNLDQKHVLVLKPLRCHFALTN